MSYPTRIEDRFTILELTGEIDLQCSPKVRKQVLECIQAYHNLLVDLAAVDYIDSSGVATLVEGYQMAKKRKLEFGLLSVSRAAMQVLELARLDQVFPIFESFEAVK